MFLIRQSRSYCHKPRQDSNSRPQRLKPSGDLLMDYSHCSVQLLQLIVNFCYTTTFFLLFLVIDFISELNLVVPDLVQFLKSFCLRYYMRTE